LVCNLDPSSIVETIQADEDPDLDPLPVNPSDQKIVTHFMKQRRDADGETHDYMFSPRKESYVPRRESDIACTMVSGQALASGLGPKFPNRGRHGFQVSLSRKDVKRLDLAGSFISKAIANSLPDYSIGPGTKAITSAFEESVPTDPISLYPNGDESPRLLCNRIANCSWDRMETISAKFMGNFALFLFLIVIVLVQAAYAGAHLGALSIMFPSQNERLLWKFSCYTLFAVTALGVIALFLIAISANYLRDYFSNIVGFVDASSTWILVTIFPVFLCARAYIVVESFISLRHVPIGVYQTPQGNIMDYVPHL
jgi:hypothetical protein